MYSGAVARANASNAEVKGELGVPVTVTPATGNNCEGGASNHNEIGMSIKAIHDFAHNDGGVAVTC